MAARDGGGVIVVQSMCLPPSADPLAAAQDALRPDQQHDDEDGQGADVLELRRDPQGRHLDEQADDERADQAPEAVPRPPRVTPAKMSSRIRKPMVLDLLDRPSITPARPASAPPTIQTMRMTRSTSMPEEAASAGLSATARVALPSAGA